MAQRINCDHHPEAGQAGEAHGIEANLAPLRDGGRNSNVPATPEDSAVADAELMVWGAKAALNVAERNLRVAYETLALTNSVLGARNNGALAASPLSSADQSPLRSGRDAAPIGLESTHKGAGLAGGPADVSSEPDDACPGGRVHGGS